MVSKSNLPSTPGAVRGKFVLGTTAKILGPGGRPLQATVRVRTKDTPRTEAGRPERGRTDAVRAAAAQIDKVVQRTVVGPVRGRLEAEQRCRQGWSFRLSTTAK